MIICTKAYPRAGLIGNPSDGYFGKTIAFSFDAFQAEATLWESSDLIIEPQATDRSRFANMDDLVKDVYYVGYYGGVRLVKASIKTFYEYFSAKGGLNYLRNFTIRYSTTIPMRVGLAGSSAIIIATLRALMKFYNVEIPPVELATLALKVETAELGIPAGLQDRVAQVYEGMIFMDFNRQQMLDYGHGRYEKLDYRKLPPLYVSYCYEMGEGTEVTHSNLRYRFEKGDIKVIRAMKRLAELTDMMRNAIDRGDIGRMNELMNENFDIRSSIVTIAPIFREMINAARNCGVSAKFCGSGGAILGISDEKQVEIVRRELAPLKVNTIVPNIVGPLPEV
jgi:glucuronokinase